MKRLLTAAFVLVIVFVTSVPAQTRTTTTSRGFGSTSLRGSTSGLSQASQQIGTVLSPQDFAAAGSGNLLRSAVAAQSMAGFNQFGQGGFGRGQFGQFGGGFNQFGNQFGNQGQNQQQNRMQLKIPLHIGTDITNRSPTGVPSGSVERFTRFEARINRIPGLETVKGVSATLDGRTVILTGTVASQRERDLVGDLALLEPGVDEVQNDLQVAKRAPLPSPAPFR